MNKIRELDGDAVEHLIEGSSWRIRENRPRDLTIPERKGGACSSERGSLECPRERKGEGAKSLSS